MSARLLLIASLNFADDHGGLDRSAKQLKAQAFPYDDIDCEPLVQELLKAGLMIEYSANGKKYLHIKGFRKHQKVEKPAKPRIPVYESSPTPPLVLPDDSPSPPRLVAVSSSEGKGRDLKIGQSDFDRFWIAYPKKVKRKTSAEIWNRKRLDSKTGELLADIQRRLESDRRWREGFIPDPTTYLNQERWVDELDVVKRPRIEGL